MDRDGVLGKYTSHIIEPQSMQSSTPGAGVTSNESTVSVEDPLPGIPKTLSVKDQERILQECGLDIHGMLDLEQIFPHLYSHNLLTDSEQELLQTSSVHCSRKNKISRLVTSCRERDQMPCGGLFSA